MKLRDFVNLYDNTRTLTILQRKQKIRELPMWIIRCPGNIPTCEEEQAK